jgi:diguanylate cyclase (GGDEF)-like protein
VTHPYLFHRRRSRAVGDAGLTPELPGRSIWRRILAPPDPLQMDVGAEGELLVARVRTALILLLVPVPVINLLLDPHLTAGTVGLGACVFALVCSAGIQALLQRDFYRVWLGLATSLLDVTLVSAALSVFLFLGEPLTTVNSRLLFEVYFIAIGATALRYDARITIGAGTAAIVQYLGLVLYAHSTWDLADPALDRHGYGTFDWATQVSRLVLLAVAAMLAAAIVLRSQWLRRQSRSDRLTGLPNRSYFDERVEAELSRARRYGDPVAFAMIDIDHFKRYNDTWGHAAGDVALRLVAGAILAGTRESDLVVRYGGEEFVALFPGMDSAAARERVEEIRRTVAELQIPIPRRPEAGRVTISAGIAAYGYDGTKAEDLLDRADTRLFEAKEGGRNTVVGPPPEAKLTEPRSRPSGQLRTDA